MTTNSVAIKIEPDRSLHTLQKEALESLSSGDGDVILDFSSVVRIDPSAIKALEQLADAADNKSVKIVLRGLNLDVYKVLKLLKLAHRFSFEA